VGHDRIHRSCIRGLWRASAGPPPCGVIRR
jgi:hypothetical protein